MIYAEAAYFDNAPVQHIADYYERKRLGYVDPFRALVRRREYQLAREDAQIARARLMLDDLDRGIARADTQIRALREAV